MATPAQIAATPTTVSADTRTLQYPFDDSRVAAAPPGTSPEKIDASLRELVAAREFAARFAEKGPNPHYLLFALSTMLQTDADAFTFIRDAVDGTGGFSDGTYLQPHLREVADPDPQTGIGVGGTRKYDTRKRHADYDNFARTICDAYWGYVMRAKDEIRRQTDVPALEDVWRNADLTGSDMLTFLRSVSHEMRMFGSGIIVVDRPQFDARNALVDQAAANRVYLWSCETQNLVDWVFDDDGTLLAVMLVDPPANSPRYVYQRPVIAGMQYYPVRIWSRNAWSVWEPNVPTPDSKTGDRIEYTLREAGVNPLGEIPIVMVYNSVPPTQSLLAPSEMRQVSVLSRSVFNIDSEIRELQRNCAFPILAIPSKNPSLIKRVVVSTEGGLAYNAQHGTPSFLQPSLEALTQLQMSRDKKVEQAYAMASLSSVSGSVKTSSGFHSQVEFDKTNQQLGQFAASLEDAETKIAYFVCRWGGASPEDARSGSLFEVTYPRDFNVRDTDAIINRTAVMLALNLGDTANRRFLRDMFETLWPRATEDEINALVEDAITTLNTPPPAPVAGAASNTPGAPAPGGAADPGDAAGQSAAKARALTILRRAGLKSGQTTASGAETERIAAAAIGVTGSAR